MLVGEDGGLIAGHARVLAARQLGVTEIPVIDSSLDRAGRALRALNHGRSAGASIAMPRARSIG